MTEPTFEEWKEAVEVKYSPQGSYAEVATYSYKEDWLFNEYTRAGSLLAPLVRWYLLPYYNPDGRIIVPTESKAADVDYPDDMLFGDIPTDDIPEGCKPFDCGYGDGWCLAVSNPEAETSTSEAIRAQQQQCEHNEQLVFEVAYKMWLRNNKEKRRQR